MNLFSHGELCLHNGTNKKIQKKYQTDPLSHNFSFITQTDCNID